MEEYLNTNRSVIISSPAGSGKTEKLSRRYISLLLGGSEIEKILCLTFTEKAAAEMKERILNILRSENPELFHSIQDKVPLMRISTIHAFCLKLLKRFAPELGIDPSLFVMDEFTASTLWSESVYECLIDEKNTPSLFFEMMKDRGIKGWDSIRSVLNNLHDKRPLSDLILEAGYPDKGDEEKKILDLYSRCATKYRDKKLERHFLDFDDLELLAYNALMDHPEWQNILYAFDEHTDHILVDEFQDTSSIQWKIIDKLTEEWRAGIGAKRAKGKIPTIFLVGDDKQSIYLFRGANVSIFQEAKKKLSEWLGGEYYFEEVKENFRSLPAIIHFANRLFEKIMHPDLYDSWRTRYTPFEPTRQGQGRVELLIVDAGENTKQRRAREALLLAKRIRSLVNRYEVFDGEGKRPCIYGDMAILLRKRTHLALFETALRNTDIPFIVVKGIGFYDEPEVSLLRELLSFIVDPMDDYSLFCVLRSPLFGIDYEMILGLITDEKPLINKISEDLVLSSEYRMIAGWLKRATDTRLAVLIEQILSETGGWRHFWEKQRLANIKKFIRIIESYESAGFSGLEIREKLIRSRNSEEPKANINAEGMDAVRIMTIHAAKGLQFPMVFLPSLDEAYVTRSNSVVINDEGDNISIAYEEDPQKRRHVPDFVRRREKEAEEEKRLFYVAVTRARDFICMLGALQKDKLPGGRLAYIADSFDIMKEGEIQKTEFFEILTEPDVDGIYSALRSRADSRIPNTQTREQVYTEPILFTSPASWRDVTEDVDIRVKHGKDWVLLGKIFHRLFEDISKGILAKDGIEDRTVSLMKNEGIAVSDINRLADIVVKDFQGLETAGYLDKIILPQADSFSEMPFILQKGNTVFKGRIDRIIIHNNIAMIYDYKTYPVRDSEFSETLEKYRVQMDIYREAVSRIFSMDAKSHILFTHRPLLVEI